MGEFMTVGIGRLRESVTNPRRSYDERGMAELVESVRQVGVLVPLLVRRTLPRGDTLDQIYEIVAGSRRLRAAQKAELTELPVRVMELTDDQVLELQVIENLQREDVHPLDEAQGYRALMATGRYEVPAIAAKVGKSESYVYQRLKLAELIPAAQKEFLKGVITAGHAILLARLQPAEQGQMLMEAVNRWSGAVHLRSVRDLADLIERTVHLRLNKAAFKAADADLLPAAGACTTCPKRTGSIPQLFPDVKAKDVCTDPSCYEAKIGALLARTIVAHEQREEKLLRLHAGYTYGQKVAKGVLDHDEWREVKKGDECAHAVAGLIVSGEGVGRVLRVCAAPSCKHHFVSGNSKRYQPSPAERKRNEDLKREQLTFVQVRAELSAAVAQADRIGKRELTLFVAAGVDALPYGEVQKLGEELGVTPIKGRYGATAWEPSVLAHLIGLEESALLRQTMALMTRRLAERGLLAVAPAWGLDPQRIRTEIDAQRDAAAAKKVAAAKRKAERERGAKAAADGKTRGKKGSGKASKEPAAVKTGVKVDQKVDKDVPAQATPDLESLTAGELERIAAEGIEEEARGADEELVRRGRIPATSPEEQTEEGDPVIRVPQAALESMARMCAPSEIIIEREGQRSRLVGTVRQLGAEYAVTDASFENGAALEAGLWKVVPRAEYEADGGEAVTYLERLEENGYEGVIVWQKRRELVLTGGRVVFRPIG